MFSFSVTTQLFQKMPHWFILLIYWTCWKWILLSFFLNFNQKIYIQLQVRNICTKMNYLDIFNHVIQFTVFQHFTYQKILLMSKINLHIIKLIKSCGSCEHIQKSNYLKKKLICHCKYNCHCFITIMDIQSKWARRAIKPLFPKLSLFWRPYLKFVDT